MEPTEIDVRCAAGELKTVIVSGVILPDTGWALATFFDITERKRAEQLLRQAQHKAHENQAIYRTLLQHSPEMMVVSPSRTIFSPFNSSTFNKVSNFQIYL